MARYRRRILLGGTVVVLVLPAWWLLAPSALGGRVSYVVVARGASMEPGLHAGDLAIMRRASQYRVGDAVAYNSRDIQRVVLHRVIGIEAGRYVLKGDNNDFVDPFKPTQRDVIGKMWLHVPLVGKAFTWLAVPIHSAAFAALVAFLAIGGATGSRQRRRSGVVVRLPTGEGSVLSPKTVGMAGAATAATVLFIVLGCFAFTRPVVRQARASLPYTHVGRFDYEASVRPGPTYEGSTVRTGQPVFQQLTDSMGFRFTYRVESKRRVTVHGSGRLVVDLASDDGWTRRIAAGRNSELRDGDSLRRVRVDLDRLTTLVANTERATGVHRDSYALVIRADVRAQGTIDGVRFAEPFSPTMTMRWTPLTIGIAAPGAENADPFDITESRTATRVSREPATLHVLGGRLDVSDARRAAAAGGGASLALALFCVGSAARRLRRSELALIALRYRSWLVSVRPGTSVHGPIVDVTSMQDLVRLAEIADEMILHEESGRTHSYYLEHGGAVYRYRTSDMRNEVSPKFAGADGEAGVDKYFAPRVILSGER